jgi:excisionase family DNA binding protein
MPSLGHDGFMSPAQVAERCGLSVKTVYRAIRSGALRAHQPTTKYLISEEAYREWVTRPPAREDVEEVLHARLRPVTPERGSAAELLAIEEGGAA